MLTFTTGVIAGIAVASVVLMAMLIMAITIKYWRHTPGIKVLESHMCKVINGINHREAQVRNLAEYA